MSDIQGAFRRDVEELRSIRSDEKFLALQIEMADIGSSPLTEILKGKNDDNLCSDQEEPINSR